MARTSRANPCTNESAGHVCPPPDEPRDGLADAWQSDEMATTSSAVTLPPTPGSVESPGDRHGRQQMALESGMYWPLSLEY